MAREVIWAVPAVDDLHEIACHIALDDEDAAERIHERLLSAGRSLEEVSERGRKVPELTGHLRELLVGKYRLIYQVSETTVAILAVVHSRRDLRNVMDTRDV